MNEQHLSGPSGGVAGALGTLRHALADPLSTVGLKLELVERRLATLPGAEPLAERVRGTRDDLAVAGRLIDLLPRLARVAEETPVDSSIDDVCRGAGLPVGEEAAPGTRLLLRRQAAVDALRAVKGLFRSADSGATSPPVRAEVAQGRVFLRIDAPGGDGDGGDDPERLFQLPRGDERAEGLFLARAAVESDGGRIELAKREGRLVALLSWPLPVPSGGEGSPA